VAQKLAEWPPFPQHRSPRGRSSGIIRPKPIRLTNMNIIATNRVIMELMSKTSPDEQMSSIIDIPLEWRERYARMTQGILRINGSTDINTLIDKTNIKRGRNKDR
jgi:hypothetical protein